MHECAKKDETKQEDGTNYLFAGRTQSPKWDETTTLLSRLKHTSLSQQQPLHNHNLCQNLVKLLILILLDIQEDLLNDHKLQICKIIKSILLWLCVLSNKSLPTLFVLQN